MVRTTFACSDKTARKAYVVATRNTKRNETNSKTMKAPQKHVAEEKSLGTRIAEVERAKANRLSESKRESLFDRGMALIYGGNKNGKTQVNSR